jgi:exopolysaccharide biosynthesis WecB/TagA/CpsF family protein
MPDIPHKDFLGFPLADLTTRQFVDHLLQAAQSREAVYNIGYLNAAQLNLAFENREFAGDMQAMECLYADGQSVVWASRWQGRPVPERINAGDFTRKLMEDLASRGLKLALLGGRQGSVGDDGNSSEADQAAGQFRQWAANLEIVFTHHGYINIPSEQADTVHDALEAADPDIVLVGMGAPRQEELVCAWSGRGRPRVWWCVGALFEYYSGSRSRAPMWMRRVGLEWMVRLALEPGRLWRRYLVGNPLFVWRVLRGRKPGGI